MGQENLNGESLCVYIRSLVQQTNIEIDIYNYMNAFD